MRNAIAVILLCSASMAQAVSAGEIDLVLDIPRLNVAEYHRPYLAVWVEREDQTVAANLAVWYETADADGIKWLPELRQWWRRSGREQEHPIDLISGASRPAGQQRLQLSADKPPFASLPAGRYAIVVEAVREVGGREVLRLPFDWPGTSPQRLSAMGKVELGTVTVTITP